MNCRVTLVNCQFLLKCQEHITKVGATCLVTPDIVCVVEYWLCSDICDSEISLIDYSIVRLDRSRHGRIILILILYLMESLV